MNLTLYIRKFLFVFSEKEIPENINASPSTSLSLSILIREHSTNRVQRTYRPAIKSKAKYPQTTFTNDVCKSEPGLREHSRTSRLRRPR